METLKLELIVIWDLRSSERQKFQPCLICWVETISWTKSTSFGSVMHSNIPNLKNVAISPLRLAGLEVSGELKVLKWEPELFKVPSVHE